MENLERKLTKAELKRSKRFEEVCNSMQANGYERKDISISTLKVNVMAMVVVLPIVFVLIGVFNAVNGDSDIFSYRLGPLVILIFFISIIIHELIHGLTWSFSCKNKWKSIDFGFIWKYITPYCTCGEVLALKNYIMGALMPTIILGFIPYIIALFTGNESLMMYSILLVICGGGDLYMILLLLKYRNVKVIDHPYLAGCVIFNEIV